MARENRRNIMSRACRSQLLISAILHILNVARCIRRCTYMIQRNNYQQATKNISLNLRSWASDISCFDVRMLSGCPDQIYNLFGRWGSMRFW